MDCRSPDITYLDRLATDCPGYEADAYLAAKPDIDATMPCVDLVQ
jgi:hypothetical protein